MKQETGFRAQNKLKSCSHTSLDNKEAVCDSKTIGYDTTETGYGSRKSVNVGWERFYPI